MRPDPGGSGSLLILRHRRPGFLRHRPGARFDHAARTGHAKIEAAKWYHPNEPSTRGRIKTERRLWTTSMTQEHFSASLDLRDDT